MNALIVLTAKYLYLIVALVALVYWLSLPRPLKLKLALYGSITAVSAFILAKIGSAIYFDPRPFVSQHILPLYPHAADNGFPSDHTLLAAAIAVAVYSISRKLGVTLFLLALVVGISRVLAHIHSPIDIIGSIGFAVLGGVIAHFVTPLLTTRVTKP